MRELRHDPKFFKAILRRKLLRSAVSAVARLDAAARGQCSFDDGDQLRACIALARLAPSIVGDLEEKIDRFDTPEWSTPQKNHLLEYFCTRRAQSPAQLNPEEWARWWLATFRDHGPVPGKYTTRAEAMEYGRQRCRAAIAGLEGDRREGENSFLKRLDNEFQEASRG